MMFIFDETRKHIFRKNEKKLGGLCETVTLESISQRIYELLIQIL